MTILAKRRFKKGELVFKCDPQVLTINQCRISKNCAYCLKEQPKLACSGCNFYNYCNDDCKELDQKWHRSECNSNLKDCSQEVRVLLRTLALNERKKSEGLFNLFCMASMPHLLRDTKWKDNFEVVFKDYMVRTKKDSVGFDEFDFLL